MLSKRFFYDGKAVLPLNNIQLKYKKQIENKIKTKKYIFESISCIVCDSNNFEKLAEKDRYGLPMNVVICKTCGLIQTNPRMNFDSYNEFYNEEYRKLYEGSDNVANEFVKQYNRGKLIYNYIKKITGNSLTNKFVVEIGTGAGGVLKFFEEQENKILGIDVDSSYISYGKKKGLNLEVGTIEKILEFNIKADLVIFSHTFEHFLNPIHELQRVKKILKEKSLVYIEVPGIRNLTTAYNQDFLRYLQNAHTFHFTLTSLKNCCMKSGFRLVSGDEFIRSLFRIDAIKNNFVSDYEPSIKFLKKIEKTRLNPLNQFIIKKKIFPFIIMLLEKTKTKKIAKKFIGDQFSSNR